jgi:hypothetical protein
VRHSGGQDVGVLGRRDEEEVVVEEEIVLKEEELAERTQTNMHCSSRF